jgi:hypothetical protein
LFEIIGAVFTAAEICAWLTIWKTYTRNKTKKLLLGLGDSPRRIPVLDQRLCRMAGQPDKPMELGTRAITKFARAFVNTKAFEYIVAMRLESMFRGKKKPLPVRIYA